MLPMVKWYMKSGKVLTPYRNCNNSAPLTEKWFKLDCGDGLKCNGKIDIITQNESVVDYKTASKPYFQCDADIALEGVGLQLTIYAAAFYQWFKRLPKKVGFQVLLKDESQIQNIAATRTLEDIEKVKKYIWKCHNRFLQLSEFNVFPKGLNPKCFWCNFREKCNSEV